MKRGGSRPNVKSPMHGRTETIGCATAENGGPRLYIQIPWAFLLRNRTQRMHWKKLRDEKHRLCKAVADCLAITGQGRPAVPIPYARVIVTRYYKGDAPDRDGYSSPKELLDVLVDPQIRPVLGVPQALHPFGLGLIEDDSPDHISLTVLSLKCQKGTRPRTTVTIESIDPVT